MKKRILEVINLASSAENFIGDQFSYFPQHGDYEMHLICSDGSNLRDFVSKHKIKYKVIPINRNITPWQDLKALVGICKYIYRNKIDIIICHQEKANLLGQMAGYIMRVPIRIILSHGILYETSTGLKRVLIKWQDRLVSSMATDIVCVSNYVRLSRIKDNVDKPEKSVVLGKGSCNGIDAKNKYNPQLIEDHEIESLKSICHIQNVDLVVGFCGRLVRDKGIEELVKAFSLLQKKYPQKKTKLLIIGGFEKRDSLPMEVSDILRKSKDVILTGHVPYGDVRKYYSLMDVLVLPSHRDGLGLAPLEAQAMKVPAIVSKCTGCKETILEHETGEYIDLNAEDICSKLELFFDKHRVEKYGESGRKFVINNFDSSLISNNMLAYLNDLVDKRINIT